MKLSILTVWDNLYPGQEMDKSDPSRYKKNYLISISKNLLYTGPEIEGLDGLCMTGHLSHWRHYISFQIKE